MRNCMYVHHFSVHIYILLHEFEKEYAVQEEQNRFR